MTEVAGTVVEVRDGRAIVACQSDAGGCAACSGGRGCSWRRPLSTRSLAVPAGHINGELQPGDRVLLRVDDARLLGAAARLYLTPLVGLLAAPALLRLLTADSGLSSLLAAALGLGGGFLLARRWTAHLPPLRLRRDAGPAVGATGVPKDP